MGNSEEKFLYAGGILHNPRDIGVNVLGLRPINLVRVDFFVSVTRSEWLELEAILLEFINITKAAMQRANR